MKLRSDPRRLLLLGLLGLVACTPATVRPADPSRTGGSEIVVFAAASLTDAFGEVAEAFQRDHPGTRVTYSFGGSNQLRAQLEQGARADVFASADELQMDAAVAGGLTVEPVRVFARNRLTIITPADNPKGVAGVRDLARPGVRLVTAQPNVPIGRYTEAMLDRAAADPTYGPDFTAHAKANVVSREENVRQVVGKVQLGEADAAVVYSSDVTPQARGQLQQVPVPDLLNTIATYPVAVCRSGANPAGAEAFVAFLLSPRAQDTLARWGFVKAAP